MNDVKQWYFSKTIWASLITVVIGTLATFGITGVEGEQEAMVESVMQIVAAVSGVVALYGRLSATKRLTKILLFLCLATFCLAGCSDVTMSPPYATQLRMSAINVTELSKRCNAGDEVACKEGLTVAAETLNAFVDALDGKGGDN